MQKKYYLPLLFLTLGIGLFLRTYRIDSVPPGIYPDESVNGEDALRAIQTGDWRWFYPANQGREGLFMNLIAICFKLFGANILTLKLPAILFGTLTILGTYLLADEIFRLSWKDAVRKKMALAAAFMVATSFWAINFSRISFRANMLPAVLTLAFYFLWKGLRTRRTSAFILGGLIFGIGMHTYIAFRVAPAVLIVSLTSLILTRPSFIREYWKKILLFVLAASLTAFPMLYTFFYAHPEYLESRSANISVFSPETNQGRPVMTLLRSFSLSLIKYNFVGDMNWRHNYPPYPLLDLIPGIAFLFGIIYSLLILLRTLKKRFFSGERSPDQDVHIFLLSWFIFMLAPEFLTAEGNPHALRSIGTLPAVFLYAGIGLGLILTKAAELDTFRRRFIGIAVVLALIFSGLFNTIKYFDFWARKPIVAQSFNRNLTLISKYLETVPAGKKVYVITGYNTLERLPIFIFHSERPETWYLYPDQTALIQPADAPFEVVLTGHYEDVISVLLARFPGHALEKRSDPLGSTYYLFK